MTTPSTPSAGHRPIVVGVEAGTRHRVPLAWAADEARRRGVPLTVVHAQGRPTVAVTEAQPLPSWQEWQHALHRSGEHTLSEAVTFAEKRHPELTVMGLLSEGEPSWVLREQGPGAEMIVLGSSFLSARQELFTSAAVALPVMAHARCPVVVVREWEHTVQERPYLVVGVDGSPTAQAAIDFAFEEAALRGAMVRAIYVWHPPLLGNLDEDAAWRECRAVLYEAVSGRTESYPDVELHHEVMPGHPVEVLVRESRHALALVTGTRGRGGFAGMLLGSVSQGALHHAQCPVVTVPRPPGW
ncbi:universal stress protein [Streptomyces piniterrae]|uniref:Universal stress protein n=1 Tax=Streptomyces piniterrae TaxID=2571125 RepID=A0A4U0NWZ0_9ACTN|nr:universal stress protein [Streptomyces piniterrae]TJZ59305.1 universal stress protein [Streptomyces piniterrae]